MNKKIFITLLKYYGAKIRLKISNNNYPGMYKPTRLIIKEGSIKLFINRL
jgi:hypothetical protein